MFLIPFIATVALAAEPVPTSYTATDHVTMIHMDEVNSETGVLAIVISCWPSQDYPQLANTTEIQAFTADAIGVGISLAVRADVSLVEMDNPTANTVITTLDKLGSSPYGNVYNKLFFVYEGLSTGGDTDDELLMCGTASGVSFAEVAKRLKPLATTAIGILDASRDVSAIAPSLKSTFGLTADDWLKAEMPNGYAMSAGPSGKKTEHGLLPAVSSAIAATHGEAMTMGDFVTAIRAKAPLLELAFSTGTDPRDQWTNNGGRQILPGGALVVAPIAATPLPTTSVVEHKRRISSGWYLAGGGAAALIGGGITTAGAIKDYGTLVEYNAEGGESQDDLDAATNSYRANVLLSAGLGGAGILAIAGGVTWAVIDNGHHNVTVVPTGNGAVVSGSF